MSGLRVQLTGSAAPECKRDLLSTAHAFVERVSNVLVDRGHGLVLTAGGEPYGEAQLPLIFDWTALSAIAGTDDPGVGWPSLRPNRFVAVATGRGLEKIPDDRRATWDQCGNRSDFELLVAPPGWRMAGIIREYQVTQGDVLLVLGGGAGAEHLAELYRAEGKPVVALNAELGAANNDGRGGGRLVHEQTLSAPDNYLRLKAGAGGVVARVAALQLRAGVDADKLARRTVDLIDELKPPTAFFVRLLDPGVPEFASVERFFRHVVDVVVTERGYTPREMGRGRPEAAFMNVEIFRALHRAALVVVDLTGVRPNCTMELGYALGRHRRFVVSAQKGTRLPFDDDKLPTYFWSDRQPDDERRAAYQDWLDRYAELPPVVD